MSKAPSASAAPAPHLSAMDLKLLPLDVQRLVFRFVVSHPTADCMRPLHQTGKFSFSALVGRSCHEGNVGWVVESTGAPGLYSVTIANRGRLRTILRVNRFSRQIGVGTGPSELAFIAEEGYVPPRWVPSLGQLQGQVWGVNSDGPEW